MRTPVSYRWHMDVIGGGILVAVAAALWIAYLLPNWLGRRQYLATERNAVRLQQALRILAETAETPEPVRMEATAREVASQQRILHEHQEAARLAAEAAEQLAIAERREAEDAAEVARSRAAAAMAAHAPVTEPIAVVVDAASGSGASADSAMSAARAARRSLRRRRAACSLTFLLALLTVVGGLIAAAFGGTLLIAAAAGGVAVAAFAGIVALARVRLPSAPAAASVEVAAEVFEPIELPEEEAVEGWTPQPLPRPLHLSRGTIAATAMASIEAAAELKRAEAAAALARRAEQIAPDVPKLRPAASAPAPSETVPAVVATAASEPANPYARMGIVDDAQPALDDLDAVLRRRRAVG